MLATAQLSVKRELAELMAEADGMSHGRARACAVNCLLLFMSLCVTRRDSAGRSQDHQQQGSELRPKGELVGHREGWNSRHHHL